MFVFMISFVLCSLYIRFYILIYLLIVSVYLHPVLHALYIAQDPQIFLVVLSSPLFPPSTSTLPLRNVYIPRPATIPQCRPAPPVHCCTIAQSSPLSRSVVLPLLLGVGLLLYVVKIGKFLVNRPQLSPQVVGWLGVWVGRGWRSGT